MAGVTALVPYWDHKRRHDAFLFHIGNEDVDVGSFVRFLSLADVDRDAVVEELTQSLRRMAERGDRVLVKSTTYVKRPGSRCSPLYAFSTIGVKSTTRKRHVTKRSEGSSDGDGLF